MGGVWVFVRVHVHVLHLLCLNRREGAADGPFFAQVGAVTGENV